MIRTKIVRTYQLYQRQKIPDICFMPPAFANTKNIGKREGTLWGEHEDKILYRAGIDDFFKKQDKDRSEDKKKFQMHSIKSITSEEEVVNATISDVYADVINRYKLLQDHHVTFEPIINRYSPRILDIFFEKPKRGEEIGDFQMRFRKETQDEISFGSATKVGKLCKKTSNQLQNHLYISNQGAFDLQMNHKDDVIYPRRDVTNAYQTFLRLHENESLNYSKHVKPYSLVSHRTLTETKKALKDILTGWITFHVDIPGLADNVKIIVCENNMWTLVSNVALIIEKGGQFKLAKRGDSIYLVKQDFDLERLIGTHHVIKSNISSNEIVNLRYRRPTSLQSRLPTLPSMEQSDSLSSKIIEVDFAPPDTGIMSLNSAKDSHHFGLASILGLPTHEFVSKNGQLNHNCGRYRFLKVSTKPSDHDPTASENIIADLGPDLLRLDKVETEIDVDHMGVPVIYMQENAVSVPFDQSEIENELDKIKILNSTTAIMDSVLEKIKSNSDLKITDYSRWGMPVPILKHGSDIVTDSEMINRFSEVLSSFGEENGKLEEFHSYLRNEVIQQLYEDKYDDSFEPTLSFNHNFLNNWVDLTKKISRSHNEPVKMSLEEEYMSRAARGTSRGGASGRDMFGSDGTKRGGPSLFGGSGPSRSSRSGGGCGSAVNNEPKKGTDSNLMLNPDQPADFIFSSLVLNRAISNSVPELSIFQTPKFKFEVEKLEKHKYKTAFFSNKDLRFMMKTLGQDMTRLNIIMRAENDIIDFSERSIQITNETYRTLRTTVRDVLAWVTGFEPTNMNPSALTTLDSLILGEIDEFADGIVNHYNNFRIKEALIQTIRFSQFLRNYCVKIESRLKAGDEFGRNSAQAILFLGISQIQQALLPILPMLGEEIGQTLMLFEKFHSDEIMMLSELDPEMLFEDIRTGLAQHWKPSEKWWKVDKEQKAIFEMINSITRQDDLKVKLDKRGKIKQQKDLILYSENKFIRRFINLLIDSDALVEYGRYAEVRLESDSESFDRICEKENYVPIEIPKDLLVGEPNVIRATISNTKNTECPRCEKWNIKSSSGDIFSDFGLETKSETGKCCNLCNSIEQEDTFHF